MMNPSFIRVAHLTKLLANRSATGSSAGKIFTPSGQISMPSGKISMPSGKISARPVAFFSTRTGFTQLETTQNRPNWKALETSLWRFSSTSTGSSKTSSTLESASASSTAVKHPRILSDEGSKAKLSSPEPEADTLTSWKRERMSSSSSSSPLSIVLPPSVTATSSSRGVAEDGSTAGKNAEIANGTPGMVGANRPSLNTGNKEFASENVRRSFHTSSNTTNDNGNSDQEGFLDAISTETLHNLMRSLFYIPLTDEGCALGFFTRVCMRDLASQWTNELQEALTHFSGKKTDDLTDTWACGFVTSCSVFRKAVNVTDQVPLVSALSGKTHLLEFDNFMNYNFSDPFLDVAFVQLTPGQIWKVQKLDFHFLPMNLNLYHDIYDKSVDELINGKDVVIAKQLQGYLKHVTREKIAPDETSSSFAFGDIEKSVEKRKTEQTEREKIVIDDSIVCGTSPAVNKMGQLMGICQRRLNEKDILLPTKMLSASIAADLNSQIDANEEAVFRPEWMDFKIGYTDLHDLGLLAHPLAHNNEDMVDFCDWPFYEAWYRRVSPINNLTFVLTDKYLYLRPEEDFLGGPGNQEGAGMKKEKKKKEEEGGKE